jgi:hypothetical protein
MKKLPLIFILFIFSCSAPKPVIIAEKPDFTNHPQPYHIFTVGQWNSDYVILTLIDARDIYFTVQAANNPTYKKGVIYTP